tara:strand:- start:351 stop:716 length:366 start_codon:yes stop_codon:yes gene_type:complete
MGMAYGTAMRQSKDDRDMTTNAPDALDQLDDAVAAEAFRRLVRHLRHRHDAQNIELMGLAGFCRNCLADWIRDAGFEGDKLAARELIHGMPMDEWKSTRQAPATEEQLARMEASIAKNRVE